MHAVLAGLSTCKMFAITDNRTGIPGLYKTLDARSKKARASIFNDTNIQNIVSIFLPIILVWVACGIEDAIDFIYCDGMDVSNCDFKCNMMSHMYKVSLVDTGLRAMIKRHVLEKMPSHVKPRNIESFYEERQELSVNMRIGSASSTAPEPSSQTISPGRVSITLSLILPYLMNSITMGIDRAMRMLSSDTDRPGGALGNSVADLEIPRTEFHEMINDVPLYKGGTYDADTEIDVDISGTAVMVSEYIVTRVMRAQRAYF